MGIRTRFTDLVGCQHPLQQAGMGGAAGPELVAAVSAAGGLGTLAQPGVPLRALETFLGEITRRTSAPFAVNFLMPFADRDSVTAAARIARLVEFFFANPDPELIGQVHAGGALAGWQVGSIDEAKAAADAGCDLVIAQGTEAGGHIRGHLPLLPLLDGVLNAVDVPVLAAGGIATGRGVAAVLAAGADAVRVGTHFLAAAEADVHPDYLDALIKARGEDTTITEAFSHGWPNAPHRVLTACLRRAESFDGDITGHLTISDRSVQIPRWAPNVPTRATTGDVRAMALYSGQGVDAIHRVQPAAKIVQELMKRAEGLFAT